MPSQASLPSVRDHLLQRRIGCQCIGQCTGVGRIRATEFNGSGGAAALGVSGVGIHSGNGAPGNPDGGVEALVYIVAVERAWSWNRNEPVEIVDPKSVVAAGGGHIYGLPKSECVGEIEAPVGREAMQVNGGSRLPCRNTGERVVRVDIGEPRVLGVIHNASIQSHADGELVTSDFRLCVPC